MLFRSYIEGLLNRDTDYFLAFTVVANDGIVKHLKLFTVNVGLKDLRSRLSLPFEDDTLSRSEEL